MIYFWVIEILKKLQQQFWFILENLSIIDAYYTVEVMHNVKSFTWRCIEILFFTEA